MDFDVPYMNLPDYYTYLLVQNMQSTGGHYKNIRTYVGENTGFLEIIRRFFSDVDPYGNVDRVIKSLGWHGLRDRLACIYLGYIQNGKYSINFDKNLIRDVQLFEDHFKKYSVQGYSRVFLLGFFLKMYEISNANNNRFVSVESLIDDKVMKKAFELAKAKVIKFDWFTITLLNFKSVLGDDLFLESIERKMTYKQMYEKLTHSEKKSYMRNILSYGASISEPSPFIERPI